MFSTRSYDRDYFETANAGHEHEIAFLEARLDETTYPLATGYDAVCVFVNDRLSREVLTGLADAGVRLVALRSAGFNHVDLQAAADLGLRVARVPAYSPYAVAEHAVALLLSLNRKIHKAYLRVREGNFALAGLEGFQVRGKTVGVIGTGKIGEAFAGIMVGFGCEVLAYDPFPNEACREAGVRYVELDELLGASDIVSLHCPLTAATRHLIDRDALARMKDGVMLINTSRGALVDTRALIDGLKSGKVGALGLDVYEEEEALFFEDHSADVIQDDVFMRLLTFPNVLVTAHQAFFTSEALQRIAETTLANVTSFATGEGELHEVVLSDG